ncbi:FAD-dependent oxidoreductase [Lutibacter sp.]|uniref:FAD-dependent oxidoreductase n=1 Tax=Lutibacter sp. TaxID=1925666 RepID=UPI001A286A9A|nr:FAD-dependent oxidoreductase [Lutibacter sp.]MBI9042072.1 FAD-dependent oxidoreductase [Lutibacter sp.]
MKKKEQFNNHYIAIIGGSISGSEAANMLAQNGFRVVVFEMNKLPYGKIEDGLPNWHVNLRDRQIAEIDSKLDQENIRFVPNTKIGLDINFIDLVNNWGFSAIILANGAWEDRALQIPTIENFIDGEVVYQNSFINWFNHKHEYNYLGKNYFIKNNIVVIGGGLASLDVIKIVMIELVKKQLYLKKAIDIDLFTIEKEGVTSILEKNNITLSDLQISKAKLIYRRTAKDMPLKTPIDESKESIEAARLVSEKLLFKYVEKYQFDFIPLSIPVNLTEENGRLSGIILQNLEIKNGKVVPIKNSFEKFNCEMIISSIGSIPEKIEGLNYSNSNLKMRDEADYQVFGFDNVFAIGNAVTGRGNIQESKQHGKQMTEIIMDKHLTEDVFEKWLTNHNNQIKNKVQKQLNSIIEQIKAQEVKPEEITQEILNKTTEIHKKIKFTSYKDWILLNTPARLEDISKNKDNCKCS